MKKIIVITFVILSSIVKAQEKINYGLKGGLSIVSLKENDTRFNSFSFQPKASFHFGGFLTYHINDKIALQPEILFSSQGAQFDVTFISETTSQIDLKPKFTLNYINVPIYLKYKIKSGFSVYAGPQFSFLTSAKFSSIETDPFEGSQVGREFETDIKDISNSFDISASLGTGYQFDFGLLIDVNYNIGFINTLDSDLDPSSRKNRVFQLSLGYRL